MNPNERFSKYQITIEDDLDDRWLRWFEDLDITKTPDGKTRIEGMLDQSALHGILNRLRDLGVEILTVQKIISDLE